MKVVIAYKCQHKVQANCLSLRLSVAHPSLLVFELRSVGSMLKENFWPSKYFLKCRRKLKCQAYPVYRDGSPYSRVTKQKRWYLSSDMRGQR